MSSPPVQPVQRWPLKPGVQVHLKALQQGQSANQSATGLQQAIATGAAMARTPAVSNAPTSASSGVGVNNNNPSPSPSRVSQPGSSGEPRTRLAPQGGSPNVPVSQVQQVAAQVRVEKSDLSSSSVAIIRPPSSSPRPDVPPPVPARANPPGRGPVQRMPSRSQQDGVHGGK